MTCKSCGLVSAVGEAFIPDARFEHGGDLLCPTCFKQEHRSFGKEYVLTFAGICVALAVALAFAPGWGLGWLCANMMLVIAVESLLILPHELGHALFGRLVGMRVFEIMVGSGKTIFEKKILGVRLKWGAIPLGGYCMSSPRRRRLVRLQIFITTLGGVLASAILIGLVFLFVTPAELDQQIYQMDERLLPIPAFVTANAIVLAVNLFPRTTGFEDGVGASDGLSLLITPMMSNAAIAVRLRITSTLEGERSLEEGRPAEAKEWFETALAELPGSPRDRHGRGLALLRLGEFEAAADQLRDVADDPSVWPELTMIALSDLALADALSGDPDALDEARRAGRVAMRNMPWSMAVRGNWGVVCARIGDTERAFELLTEAATEGEDPILRAIHAASLGRLYREQGDPSRAGAWIDRARQWDPGSVALSEPATRR